MKFKIYYKSPMLNIKTNKNFKNIDLKEIEKFDKSALEWWNTTGIFKSLHNINAVRSDYILENSNGLFNKKVLDIGCGGGLLAESMARNGAHVVGIDISANSLKIAKLHALSQNLIIDYILETTEEHTSNHINYYDIITCMELLEHVPNPLSIIQSCNSMIKPKGSVFFSTINRTFKSWLMIIIGAEYILKIIPKNTHMFKKFITPSELLIWTGSTNLQAKKINGILYNPFTNHCEISTNIQVNYILHTTYL